jgi:hypothetical protein
MFYQSLLPTVSPMDVGVYVNGIGSITIHSRNLENYELYKKYIDYY